MKRECTAHFYGVVMTLRESDNEFGREHKGQYLHTHVGQGKHTGRLTAYLLIATYRVVPRSQNSHNVMEQSKPFSLHVQLPP